MAKNIVRYGVSLSMGVCLFVAINYKNFFRPHICSDCFFPYGLPFTFFREGGFGDGGGIVWGGVMGDLLLVIGFAAAIAWGWKFFLNRRNTPTRES